MRGALVDRLRSGCVIRASRLSGSDSPAVDIDKEATEDIMREAADAIERALRYAEYAEASRLHPQHKRGVHVMYAMLAGDDP